MNMLSLVKVPTRDQVANPSYPYVMTGNVIKCPQCRRQYLYQTLLLECILHFTYNLKNMKEHNISYLHIRYLVKKLLILVERPLLE